jgi:methylmalonyl-CoA/ethylmalonyl-CoA epimerase
VLSKIDHIGIAVKSLEEAVKVYTGPLGLKGVKVEALPDRYLRIALIPVGDTKVELIEPTSPEADIAKFIEKKGEGMHHMAFEVKDIDAAVAMLKAQQVPLIDETPRDGAGGARIAFINPKATKVLVELVQPGKE